VSTNTSSVTTGAVQRSLYRSGPHWPSIIFQGLLALSLLVTLLALIALLLDVLNRGLPVFAERGMDFLTSPLSSDPSKAGVSQALWGTFWIGVIVAVTAFPLGVATAVYLEEYASGSRLTRLVDVNIRNLAGVPSIVYGLLGLAVFVGFFKAIGAGNGRNVIAGGLTVAALVLPIVIITAAEAIRAVPNAIREAGYGVGASRWQVTANLVVPAAFPGIMTGIVLSLSRALGETAPLILAGAVLGSFSSGNADLMGQLLGPYTALPMVVYRWTTLPQEEFRQLAAAGMIVLLVITFAANALAIYLRNHYSRVW
jgi:phosphate transport system permease protein